LTKNEETWSHVIFIHILASCHRKNSENDLNWTCRNRCITSKSHWCLGSKRTTGY